MAADVNKTPGLVFQGKEKTEGEMKMTSFFIYVAIELFSLSMETRTSSISFHFH